MTAWDDIRFEWARGSYRFSAFESVVVMNRVAELEELVRDVAAMHPQSGPFCAWCRCWMSPVTLNPPDAYNHESSCVWLRAASATTTPPVGLEGHTPPLAAFFERLDAEADTGAEQSDVTLDQIVDAIRAVRGPLPDHTAPKEAP